MFGKIISKLFGGGNTIDFKQLLAEGALVLDVRTAEEFKSGHIKGAKNISVQTLASNLNKLKKDQVIITCCKSGMRSANAKNILIKNGFEAHNGGGWASLNQKLK